MARANRFDQLIDAWDPRLKAAFLKSIEEIRNGAQIEQIARMIEQGDVDGAIRAVGLDPVQFRTFDRTFSQAYEAGGNATQNLIPVIRDTQGLRVVFQFNIRNPRAEDYLRRHAANFVRDIYDDQRQMIRNHLEAGMSRGLNPRTVALDLVGRVNIRGVRSGGVIGLTDSQASWVRNYANELENDLPASLTRNLRDQRFDRAVLRAIDSGEGLSAELRQKMVTAYENRALRYRAETIARTEAMRALHQSQDDSIAQAVESGSVANDQVAFAWRTAHDNRVRDSHQSMDGQQVQRGESFVSGNGNSLMFPGDPEAPIEETANCRCWREPVIDFLAGIR